MVSLVMAAKISAVVFISIGILGFVPVVTTNGYLLGIFEVDTVHNLINLISGLVAGACAMVAGSKYVRGYFQLFGVVYALITVLGFALNGDILGVTHFNVADHVLHLAVATIFLFMGFGTNESSVTVA